VTEANVDTLRRGYEALNRGDLTDVMDLIDENLVWDGGDLSPDGQSPTPGRASFEAFVRSWIDAFDDFRIEPREVIEEEPFLLALVRQSGRGRASGAPIEIEIAHLWTIADGRAIRLQSHRTRDAALDAMRQHHAS
jgi:ketosteroid isomerase-like protein